MRQLSQNIIELNNLNEKINFYFETLIVDLKFNNNEWTLESKNGTNLNLNILSVQLICYFIRGHWKF